MVLFTNKKALLSAGVVLGVPALVLIWRIITPHQNQSVLPPPPPPSSSPQANSTTQDPTKNWHEYQNKELGILFKYPVQWQELKTKEELCLFEDGSHREYTGEACVHIQLFVATLAGDQYAKPIFLGAQSRLFAQHMPGRGAYFGDLFSLAYKDGLTPGKFVSEYCQTHQTQHCSVQTNPQGILYAKNSEPVFTAEPDDSKKAIYYFIYHPNHQFPGIVLSTEGFNITPYAPDIEKAFDTLMTTVKFTN